MSLNRYRCRKTRSSFYQVTCLGKYPKMELLEMTNVSKILLRGKWWNVGIRKNCQRNIFKNFIWSKKQPKINLPVIPRLLAELCCLLLTVHLGSGQCSMDIRHVELVCSFWGNLKDFSLIAWKHFFNKDVCPFSLERKVGDNKLHSFNKERKATRQKAVSNLFFQKKQVIDTKLDLTWSSTDFLWHQFFDMEPSWNFLFD